MKKSIKHPKLPILSWKATSTTTWWSHPSPKNLKFGRHQQLQTSRNLNSNSSTISSRSTPKTPKKRSQITTTEGLLILHFSPTRTWSRNSSHCFSRERDHISSEDSPSTSWRLLMIKLLIMIITSIRKSF